MLDNAPMISIDDRKNEPTQENEKLNKMLDDVKFYRKLKEALKKSYYFNLVLIQPVWRDKVLELDILTPDMFTVIPKNNFNKIKSIALERVEYNEDGTSEIYYVIYTDTEHYRVTATGERRSIEGNPNDKNIYGVAPFGIMRMNEGIDFYGEPNWNLYINQLSQLLQLVCYDTGIFFQSNPLWLAVNLNLPAGQTVDPTKLIEVNNVGKEDAAPELKAVQPEFPGEMLLNNIKTRTELVHNSESIPASSASIDVTAQSGAAKTIDEIEIQENRNDMLEMIFDFIKEFIPILITVYNNPPKGVTVEKIKYDAKNNIIGVQLSEEKVYQSIDDKTKQRKMEKQNFIKDEVDFVMEDLEITEEKAIEHVKKLKKRAADMKLEDTPKFDDTGNPIVPPVPAKEEVPVV